MNKNTDEIYKIPSLFTYGTPWKYYVQGTQYGVH